MFILIFYVGKNIDKRNNFFHKAAFFCQRRASLLTEKYKKFINVI